MKLVTLGEIKDNLDTYLHQSTDEQILITDQGKAIAAVNIIVDPDELERMMLANNTKFHHIITQSKVSLNQDGGLKSDEFWTLVDELSTQKPE
ncbi:MAG: type II toxin-antitoxin system Phd/YefM family antitoxin [Prochloron sp. SP5CPC1]|nr:type II toxin-antitoxin system Phd/YefM family antitoxin [Candidatus Paraprochloron terpiosi SP5CPC1]